MIELPKYTVPTYNPRYWEKKYRDLKERVAGFVDDEDDEDNS